MDAIANKIKEYDKKTIFTCSSVYHVLISVCLILISHIYKESYIVMFSSEKKQLAIFREISAKLLECGIKNVVIDKHTPFHRAIGISDIQNKYILGKIIEDLNISKEEYLLVNCTWNQQRVTYPASLYLKYAYKSIFIEEGVTQFLTPDENAFFIFLKKIYGNQTRFWKLNKVEAIYVQEPDRFPDYLVSSLTKFSITKCFEKLKKNDIEKLILIFVKEDDVEEVNTLRQNRGGVIFTQPLSEDGYITEKEKIRIYKEIVEFYSKYGVVYLKVHPRDTTQYLIEDACLLQGTYPSELLSILKIEFDFAVGLCTSAIETVVSKKRINLNEKFLTELKYNLLTLEEM